MNVPLVLNISLITSSFQSIQHTPELFDGVLCFYHRPIYAIGRGRAYGTTFFVRIIMLAWPSDDVKVHTATFLSESMVHLNEEGISSPVAWMMPPVVMLKVPYNGVVDPSDP
jgi:hypothetical protein